MTLLRKVLFRQFAENTICHQTASPLYNNFAGNPRDGSRDFRSGLVRVVFGVTKEIGQELAFV